MSPYLKSSILISFFNKLSDFYNSSYIKQALETMDKWYKFSNFNKIIVRYLEKDSKAEATLTYRILSAFGKAADAIVGKIRRAFAGYSKHSKIFNFFRSIISESYKSLYILIALPLTTFTVGYSVVVTYKGIWNAQKFLYISFLLLTSLILSVIRIDLKSLIKTSVFYKFYLYIME
jgi:hypothetical protein